VPRPAVPGLLVCARALAVYSILSGAGATRKHPSRRQEADAELSNAAIPRPEPRFASDCEAAQREAFLRDGFVVVPGLFDEEEIARISDWTDDLERRPDEPGRAMKYFEPSLLRPGERVLQRIENFCPFHDGFAELCDGE